MSTTVHVRDFYKTARLTAEAQELIATPIKNDGFVRVQFDHIEFNVKHQVDEKIYRVYWDLAEREFVGHFFARALTNFVL